MTAPLTDTERRAATEIGQGVPQSKVATDTLKGSTSKVRTLLKRDDFQALIEEAREAAEPPAPVSPVPGVTAETPQAVLESALASKQRDGGPTRMALDAAKILANLEAAKANENAATHSVERELVTLDAKLDGQVREVLADAEEGESIFVLVAARDCGPNATGARVITLTGPWKSLQADAPTDRGNPSAEDS